MVETWRVNIRRLGAKGDGVADDTGAFAGAIAAAAVVAATCDVDTEIVVPLGTYRISALHMPGTARLVGGDG